MSNINYKSNVLVGPEDKGAQFAANSPKNVSREKFLKKSFVRGSRRELGLEMGIPGGESHINLTLRFM